ncbi:MAG: hypothetical protein RL385_449 [Pseudomonadota bacterium]|jgi:hypothetical protein
MSKHIMLNLFVALIVGLTGLGCDNGPVGKALNCAKICDKFHSCFASVDESTCREECRDDAAKSDVASCSECLDTDSCTQCSARCAGVGIDLLF